MQKTLVAFVVLTVLGGLTMGCENPPPPELKGSTVSKALSGRKDPDDSYDPKYDQFAASDNIDDRRGLPEDADIDPGPEPPDDDLSNTDLAKQAGIDDVPTSPPERPSDEPDDGDEAGGKGADDRDDPAGDDDDDGFDDDFPDDGFGGDPFGDYGGGGFGDYGF